eukprot:1252412-Rhodomonas_salina.3
MAQSVCCMLLQRYRLAELPYSHSARPVPRSLYWYFRCSTATRSAVLSVSTVYKGGAGDAAAEAAGGGADCDAGWRGACTRCARMLVPGEEGEGFIEGMDPNTLRYEPP